MSAFISVSLLLFVINSCISAQTNRDLFVRNKRPLPIDGSWSDWQSWSTCYKNTRDHNNFYAPMENFEIQSRNRSCTSPKPIHGGKECKPPSHRFRQCSCMNPLGMSTKLINDSQISSSPFLRDYPPSQARLSEDASGWCSKNKISYLRTIYLQIDFNQFANVGALVTLNNKEGRIVSYKAEYSLNGVDWKKILPEKGTKGKFRGNLLPDSEKISNFSGHKVMKFLRVLPTKSYGSYPCLKMEALGCIFTCGKVLTGSFGKITARSRIDIDQNCLWRIEVLNTTALTFDFSIFDIMCKHGYLDFHDGDYEFSNSPLLNRICLKNRDEEPPILKINSNIVWLNFVSNSSDSEDGFSIRYFSECKQTIQLVLGVPVIVKSPNYPQKYFGNLECIWTISAPPGSKETMDITVADDFSVESSTGLCSDDFVTIKYYKNKEETALGSFCNVKKPESKYKLNADKIIILFKTDPISVDKGFHFSIMSGVEVKTPTKTNIATSTLLPNILTGRIPVNGSGDGHIRTKKKTRKNGSDWTVIIISAFSAIVLLLFITVVGMNIRRFINNRNEVNAQCAKVAAKNKEKQYKENKKKQNQNMYEVTTLLQTPEKTEIDIIPIDNQNNIEHLQENDEAEILHDSVDGECSHLMSSLSGNDSELNDNCEDSHTATAEIDNPSDYEDSILHVHSPLKTSNVDSTPDASSTPDVSSSLDVNSHGEDVESCV